MDLATAILESWDRNRRIVKAVADRIDDTNRNALPSPDGWPIIEHLAHIHEVRRFHLDQLDEDGANSLPRPSASGYEDLDLNVLRGMLDESAGAVRKAMKEALDEGRVQCGGYDHPLFFLEHLIWHEGWHIALIFLALRLAGQDPPEEWSESRVWGEWRTD